MLDKETEVEAVQKGFTIAGWGTLSGTVTTYISSPCCMFDVILGTTSGLNIAKINLLA